MGAAGTYKFLYLSAIGFLSGSQTYVVTLRVNGVDTGLTLSMSAGVSSGSATGSVTVAAGDRVTMKYVQSGTSISGIQMHVTVF